MKIIIKSALFIILILFMTMKIMNYSSWIELFGLPIEIINACVFPIHMKPKVPINLDSNKIINLAIYNTRFNCACCENGSCPENSIIGFIQPKDKVKLLYLEIGEENTTNCFKIRINDHKVGYIYKTNNLDIDSIRSNENSKGLFKTRIRIFSWL